MSSGVQRSNELERKSEAEKPHPPKKKTWKGHSIYLIGAMAVGVLIKIASKIHILVVGKMTIKDHEELVRKNFSNEADHILDKLKSLPPKEYNKVVKRLSYADIHERPLIAALSSYARPKVLQEILKGAHVRIQDDGSVYKQLRQNPMARPRRSSHPSTGQQYAIRGNFLSEHLFGQLIVGDECYSWFQLENHPMTFGHVLRHMLDYFKYKASGKQQGPHGSSKHTDKKPLVLLPPPLPLSPSVGMAAAIDAALAKRGIQLRS